MITPQQRREIQDAIDEHRRASVQYALAYGQLLREDLSREERERRACELPEQQRNRDAHDRLFDLLAAVTDYSSVPTG